MIKLTPFVRVIHPITSLIPSILEGIEAASFLKKKIKKRPVHGYRPKSWY